MHDSEHSHHLPTHLIDNPIRAKEQLTEIFSLEFRHDAPHPRRVAEVFDAFDQPIDEIHGMQHRILRNEVFDRP